MDTVLLPQAAPSEAPVTLDDKYARFDGSVYLTGIQALVRLPLLQKRRDRAAGKHTAVAARSSLTPGWNTMSCASRCFLALHKARS
jgi:indolepyruvate ferredoxin oxidoreductase